MLTFVSASALIVSGFVYVDAVNTPAEANGPGSSSALKVRNTVDYYATLEGSSNWMKSRTTTGPIPATGDFTIETWLFDPSTRTSFSTILAQRGSTGIGNRFEIQVDRSTYLDQELIILYRDQTIRTLFKLPQDRWVHLAVTLSSTTLTLYMDGSSVFSTTNSATAQIQGPFFVGRTFDDANKGLWSGQIDQIKVWGGALTSGNVVESMHSWGSSGVTSPPSLLAHYDFNDRTTANGIVLNKAVDNHHLDITGSVPFEDIKVTNQFNSKTIYTFPRTYLTEVGGWVVPTGVTSIPEALVVGAGGGGGPDGGNGGGGGAGQVGSIPTVASEEVLKVRVGQGGVPSTNGQSSAISSGATELANAGGGTAGGGWQAVGVSAGGTGASFANFTAYSGGAGGEGPASSGEGQSAVSGGQSGSTQTDILNGGLASTLRFGGGGGGGIGTVDTGTIPNISAASGGAGGGGEGASTGAIGTGKYFCGDATSGTGVSTGGNGFPNTGGGGGAGSAYGGPTSGTGLCRGTTNSGYDGERTFGGHGGSGVVVLSVQMEAKCVYLNEGSTVTQKPRIFISNLTGISGGSYTLTPAATTASPYAGNTITLSGWIYFADVGRAEIRRIRTDGSNPQILGSAVGLIGGLTTDGTYIYGHTSNSIVRLDIETNSFNGSYVSKGDYAGGDRGSIAYGYSEQQGYLLFTRGYLTSQNTHELIYRVNLSNLNISIFARNRLSAAEPINGRPITAITVNSGVAYWASSTQPTSGSRILSKSLSSPGEFADSAIQSEQFNVNAIASHGSTLYWNSAYTTSDLRSSSVSGGSIQIEPSTVSFVRTGINPQSVCNSPTNFPLQLSSNTTDFTASWTQMPGAGTKPQILQYRLNNGAWTTLLEDSTSTSSSLAKPNSNGTIVEFRVTSFEYGQWQEWVHSDSIVIELYSTPAPCADPMKLKYVVPAGGKIELTFGRTFTPITIRWGDGTELAGLTFSGATTSNKTYSSAGTYIVEVCGIFQDYNGTSNPKPYLTEVIQWGEWWRTDGGRGTTRTISNAFSGASNLVSVPSTFPTTITTAFRTFMNATRFNDPNVLTWDVTNLNFAQDMFSGATSFNQPIGNWNTGKITNFTGIFSGATSFNQDLSNWDTSSATSFASMFSNASKFNNGGASLRTNVNKWNTSKVTSMASMFSNTPFNQDITNWDTSKIVNFSSMFWRARSFNQDLSNWNVSSSTTLTGMFQEASSFNHDTSGWNTAKVMNMASMFSGATAYKQKVPKLIGALTSAAGMLNYSGISDATYGEILVEWAAATKLTGVALGAVDKTAVCGPAYDALMTLIGSPNNWVITDKTNRTANFCAVPVTVTAKNTTQVYGDPVPSVGFTVSAPNFDGASWLNDITCKAKVTDAGADVSSSTAVANNYVTKCTGPSGSGIGLAITYVNGTHAVTKRPLSIRVQNRIKIATESLTLPISTTSGSDTTASYVITSGNLVNSDQITVSVDQKIGGDDISVAGSYLLAGDLAGTSPSSNYAVTFTDGTLTVSTKSIVVTGKNVTKTYGDSISLNNSDGWVCEGTDCTSTLANKVTLSSSGLSSSANAGTYPITSSVTGLSSNVYDVVNTNGGTVTVAKKQLVVTPVNLNAQAGQSSVNYSFNITGFVNGQGRDVIDTLPTCASGFTSATSRGTELTITCSGGQDNNYDFVYQSGTLTVPELSNFQDLTPTQVAPDGETGSVVVPFKFVITPFLQICYATLQVNYISPDGEIIPNEPIRVLVDSSTIEFELELYEGEYDYTFTVDGNCAIEPTVKPLLIAPFSGGGFFIQAPPQPLSISPFNAAPYKRTPAVITGTGLGDVVEIRIGKKTVRKVTATDTTVSFRIPKLKPGRFDILLVMKDGTILRWEQPLRIMGKIAGKTRNQSFAGFTAGSYQLSATLQRSIRQYLVANRAKYKVIECVGYTDGPFVRRTDVPLAMNRARIACNLAKSLGYQVVSRSYVNEQTPGPQNRRVKLILGK
jgi:surface protein